MKTALDILNEKKNLKIHTVPSTTAVKKAIEKMTQKKIGSILIEEDNTIVGIWTERDLLKKMGSAGDDFMEEAIQYHMNSPVKKVSYDTPLIRLEEMFLGLFIRHILVHRENQDIGVLSIGDVLRASLLEKDSQIKKLNQMASWQYYENWSWEQRERNEKQ